MGPEVWDHVELDSLVMVTWTSFLGLLYLSCSSLHSTRTARHVDAVNITQSWQIYTSPGLDFTSSSQDEFEKQNHDAETRDWPASRCLTNFRPSCSYRAADSRDVVVRTSSCVKRGLLEKIDVHVGRLASMESCAASAKHVTNGGGRVSSMLSYSGTWDEQSVWPSALGSFVGTGKEIIDICSPTGLLKNSATSTPFLYPRRKNNTTRCARRCDRRGQDVFLYLESVGIHYWQIFIHHDLSRS